MAGHAGIYNGTVAPQRGHVVSSLGVSHRRSDTRIRRDEIVIASTGMSMTRRPPLPRPTFLEVMRITLSISHPEEAPPHERVEIRIVTDSEELQATCLSEWRSLVDLSEHVQSQILQCTSGVQGCLTTGLMFVLDLVSQRECLP